MNAATVSRTERVVGVLLGMSATAVAIAAGMWIALG
jgi:hypothetical protein